MKTFEFDQVTTKNGDRGTTTNWDGDPIRKDAPIFDLIGDIDELSTAIGTARLTLDRKMPWMTRNTIQDQLGVIQVTLQNIMSLVATNPKMDWHNSGTPTNPRYLALRQISEETVVHEIEVWERELLKHGVEIPNRFVLPGGVVDTARVICRRAERKMVAFMAPDSLNTRSDLRWSSVYLNRLSDLLFILGISNNDPD
jgi:cob(I)alamin adenosyltransferase